MKFVRPYLYLLLLLATMLNSRGAIVHGVVQDSAGEPIFNASVTIGNGLTSSYLYTGVNGEFVFEVPSGIYILSASAYFSVANAWTPAQRELVVCGEELEIVLQLDKWVLPRKINGQLTSGGDPWGFQAEIYAHGGAYPYLYLTTNTDVLGHFSLPVSPGNWTVSVSPHGVQMDVLKTVTVSEDEDSNIEIPILSQELSATFTVIDENSNAVPSVYINFWARRTGVEYSKSAQSDSLGNCTVGLFSGEWDLSVYDWPSGLSARQTISVSGFGSNFVVVVKPSPWISPPPASATWGGYVRDESGLSLTNLAIGYSSGTESNTDDQGAFILHTTVGYHSFSISETNFIAPRGFWVAEHASETNVQVILHRADSLVHVKVTDHGGNEIVGASVSAATYTNGWLYTQDGITDCEGQAALRLFAGQWIVHAQSPARTNRQASQVSRQVSIATGPSHLSFEIDGPPRAAFYANLFDENGKRLSSSGLTLYELGSLPSYYSYDFSPIQLSPGRWRLADQQSGSEGYLIPSLNFDFLPASSGTNITLVRKRGTNTVLARIGDSQATGGFTITASTFLQGTNYTTSGQCSGTNHCALQLFEGDWQFSAMPNLFEGYLTLRSTNYHISGLTSEVEVNKPVTFQFSDPTNMTLVRGRVVDESNAAWPFIDINNCPTRSDGSFSLMADQIWVSHPLHRFSMGFYHASELGNDVTLVMPRNLHTVNIGLLDSNSNALPVGLVAYSQSGLTNYQAQNWTEEDGRSLLFLTPGKWTFFCWDQDKLNALGYQSFEGFNADITSSTNITISVTPLTVDSRRPRLALSRSSSGMELTFKSETAATYLMQRSMDLRTWHTLETIYTGGENAWMPFTEPRTNSFYRTVWLQDGYY
jgi:hypothetical protein